ncbi:MAG: hypothetical protein JAY99_14500 [Candidatus Thiodiazotropha lotti]|nr:hypothetical protein [Candidatus Thiodiazotropha lotti]MCW4184592.1 hypothetical protein [Candidatus Thiodiazotropha weberae]MCG7992930.1 hypothetical protein [Candidatus Thiodiazotropha lotti]MCG8000728.1 hypothetical protein [Candidatus Thiodiazotropha lotti]MCW4192501.1 hypothetical protein [Candidatus Thiodiazotropha weberae]
MQTIASLVISTILVIFGLFDIVGILWASGLSKNWLEFLWWWTPAVSLILGGVLPNKFNDILYVRLFLVILALLGVLYSLHRIEVSWTSPGIDSTNNVIRLVLVVFVIFRFGSPFFNNTRNK